MVATEQAAAGWPRQVATGIDRDSIVETHLLPSTTWNEANAPALRAQLERDGFLYLPGLLPAALVAKARQIIAEDLAEDGFISPEAAADLSSPLFITSPPDISPSLLDRLDLQNDPEIASVLEHPFLRNVMSLLLDAPDPTAVQTHPYKWMRAVGPNLFTGPHVDATYFPPSDYPRLLTAWIPLAPTTTTLGSLMIAPDLAATPLALGADSDGTSSGWIKNGKEELERAIWKSSDMALGDVVVIDCGKCLHMSSRNVAEPPHMTSWRLKTDTAWDSTLPTNREPHQPYEPSHGLPHRIWDSLPSSFGGEPSGIEDFKLSYYSQSWETYDAHSDANVTRSGSLSVEVSATSQSPTSTIPLSDEDELFSFSDYVNDEEESLEPSTTPSSSSSVSPPPLPALEPPAHAILPSTPSHHSSETYTSIHEVSNLESSPPSSSPTLHQTPRPPVQVQRTEVKNDFWDLAWPEFDRSAPIISYSDLPEDPTDYHRDAADEYAEQPTTGSRPSSKRTRDDSLDSPESPSKRKRVIKYWIPSPIPQRSSPLSILVIGDAATPVTVVSSSSFSHDPTRELSLVVSTAQGEIYDIIRADVGSPPSIALVYNPVSRTSNRPWNAVAAEPPTLSFHYLPAGSYTAVEGELFDSKEWWELQECEPGTTRSKSEVPSGSWSPKGKARWSIIKHHEGCGGGHSPLGNLAKALWAGSGKREQQWHDRPTRG
ncbi:hypothetical protein RQP46_003082 [Phenoliferia psychrophenolica]